MKEKTLHDTLGNEEAKVLVDKLPDVLRDVKIEKFKETLGNVYAKVLVDTVAQRLAIGCVRGTCRT